MCGLCGIVSSTFGIRDRDMFKTLLYVSAFRGMDSTGVLSLDKEGFWNKKKFVYTIRKRAYSPHAFLYLEDSKKASADGDKEDVFLGIPDKYALLGHARAATKGTVSRKNAHPFDVGKIVGMHNGTIHKKFKHTEKYETDSEALIHLISDVGIKEALQEAHSFSAAYAITWLDKTDSSLHFIRNNDRPLWFCYVDGGKTLLWASETSMLRFALARSTAGVCDLPERIKKGEDKELMAVSNFFQLKENYCMSINLHDKDTIKTPKIEEVKIKKIYSSVMPGKKGNYNRDYGYAYGGWEDWDSYIHNEDYEYENESQAGGTKSSTTSVPKVPKTRTESNNSVNCRANKHSNSFNSVIVSNKGREHDRIKLFSGFVSRKEFEELLKPGCKICGQAVIPEKDVEFNVRWFDDENYACSDCQEHDYVRMLLGDEI